MENENAICGVCFVPYDAAHHLPRVLINCGHTLCSSCLIEILKSKQLQKCPFDNFEFEEAQKCLENFPVNFALLALLEGGRNQDVCKIHSEKLVMFCLQEKVKICYGCALFGEHKGHVMKKIKDLKAKGIKAKKDLEESIAKLMKSQLERDQEMEQKRKELLVKMKSRCGEIRKILKKKESEWSEEIDDLFERNNTENESGQKEAEKLIEEIDQAFQKDKEENLATLDGDFGSMISNLQSRIANEQVAKLSDENSRMLDGLESFLVNQAKSIQNFRMKPENLILKKEELEQEQKIKAKTRLTLQRREGSLFFDVKNPNPIYLSIDIEKLGKAKKVNIELERYDSLLSEPTDLNLLSEILKKLKKYVSLSVSFDPEGLSDDHVRSLFDHLFCRVQHLAEIEISFERCKITNKSVIFFCNNILPKATSLRNLTLKLGFTLISNASLSALAKSLSLLGKKLESFKLGVGSTVITDNGIEEIFEVNLGVKALALDLKRTSVTDGILKMIGSQMMCYMKNLEKLTLDGSETKITMEGVNAVFTGIPKGIKRLNLDFSHVKLSDQVVAVFEKKMWPKLELAEDVYVRLEGVDLAGKMPKSLKAIRKGAEKRKKVCQMD